MKTIRSTLSVSQITLVCAGCKKVHSRNGSWKKPPVQPAMGSISHGLCPACAHHFYPEFFKAPNATVNSHR